MTTRTLLASLVVALALSGAAAGQALTDAQIEFTPEPPADLDFFWYDVRRASRH